MNNRLAAFDAFLKRTAPFMSQVISKLHGQLGDDWACEFSEALERLYGDDDVALEQAVSGYVAFALEALKLQVAFRKTGRYPEKGYAQAAEEVYNNPDYMRSLYLPGNLLCHYLWPHHYQQLRWFRERFAPRVVQLSSGEFYDVGTGTGFYSRELLRVSQTTTGVAFDVSSSSLDFARTQIAAYGLQERWTGVLRDVCSAQAIVARPILMCVEVLEHLAEPEAFLAVLRKLLSAGGVGFVTAAINAANRDHIYLYRSAEDVLAQITAAGFTVLEYGSWESEGSGELVPAVAAFILE
ncbi:MAG: class I SAM-dependent methyltransferase [Desulfovibrionaceae bacterium]